MKNRNITSLESIIRFCQDIERLHNTYGEDYENYKDNLAYQYSVSFCVEQIGELAKKLRDNGIAEKYPDVQWNEIAGLRNRIAHSYGSIDLEMVFDISIEEVPMLMHKCISILRKEKEAESLG